MKMYQQTGEFVPDKLFAGEEIPVLRKAITLATGQGVLARGAVLFNDGGVYKIVSAATNTAEAVLTDEVDTSEKQELAVAYITGHFNAGALVFGGGLSYADFELPLRRLGIYARKVQEG